MGSSADLSAPMIGASPAEPMEPVPYRVVARVQDAPHIATLRLVPVAARLGAVAPGQFMMLWVPGVGEVPISVSGVAAGGSLDFTVQAVGATSAAVVGAVEGDVIGLRGPFGSSWPVAAAAGRQVLVVAGGVGLAPLRMAVDALVAGEPAPSRLTLLVGAREPATLLYPTDLDRWSSLGAVVRTTVDVADRTWRGSVGMVTSLIDVHATTADLCFVCGPEVMMTAVVLELLASGIAPDHVYVSLERNMHCGIAHCGRCQLGPFLLCRDGAVLRWDRVAELVEVWGR